MLTLLASVVFISSVLSPRAPTQVIDTKREIQVKRPEALDNLQTRRQEASEKAQNRREEFRERVAEIRDERAQRILNNLAERFDTVNEKWTSHWTRVLSRFSEILAKMKERVGRIGDETGKDVSVVLGAIKEAEADIAAAQEAVNAQAAKSYTPEIDNEANIGKNVRALVSQFRADLKATLEHVQGARKSMTDALSNMKSLAQVKEGGEENEVE